MMAGSTHDVRQGDGGLALPDRAGVVDGFSGPRPPLHQGLGGEVALDDRLDRRRPGHRGVARQKV